MFFLKAFKKHYEHIKFEAKVDKILKELKVDLYHVVCKYVAT